MCTVDGSYKRKYSTNPTFLNPRVQFNLHHPVADQEKERDGETARELESEEENPAGFPFLSTEYRSAAIPIFGLQTFPEPV
ncbi:hypothetical protein NDU88_001787 [Pleurodeles waltl]|uniref:Uncharacterized protein n=1 Tax=Pleurodeles waltl TaxID=8319 RepID=A0AAV7Q863_PLEWA|nr:hypothetical protein NDU88_001787 [Pleurodeles waltl]